MNQKNISYFLLGFFAIGISVYALAFLFPEMKFGLLDSKEDGLLNNKIWRLGLGTHVLFGAIALVSGWSQFIPSLRKKRMSLHRTLGKIYLVAVLLSGASGFYVALYATGGWLSTWGFSTLAILWLITSIKAYIYVRRKDINSHRDWMIRSYALCFAAVTLRIWLPVFTFGFAWEFIFSYRIISFLCWIPNLLFGEWLIKRI